MVENCDHLSHNFTCSEVPFHTEQRRQAELAIDCATHLAGNANSGALPLAASLLLDFGSGVAAVTSFAIITFRHPDSFDGFVIRQAHQVTHCAVG